MKVFIADYIGIIYLEEKFLKKGHTVYLNVNRSFNHKLRDISDLNIKYPNQLIFVEDKKMLDEVVPMVDFGIQYNCGNPSIIDRVFKKDNLAREKNRLQQREDTLDHKTSLLDERETVPRIDGSPRWNHNAFSVLSQCVSI